MNFNTAVSAMMILVNEIYKAKVRPKSTLKTLAQLLMPFAPHVAEEVWARLGEKTLISLAPWPSFDSSLVVDNEVEMGVQVNGKHRGSIIIPLDAPEEEALALAKSKNTVAKAMGSMAIAKVIYKPGRILNIIVK